MSQEGAARRIPEHHSPYEYETEDFMHPEEHLEQLKKNMGALMRSLVPDIENNPTSATERTAALERIRAGRKELNAYRVQMIILENALKEPLQFDHDSLYRPHLRVVEASKPEDPVRPMLVAEESPEVPPSSNALEERTRLNEALDEIKARLNQYGTNLKDVQGKVDEMHAREERVRENMYAAPTPHPEPVPPAHELPSLHEEAHMQEEAAPAVRLRETVAETSPPVLEDSSRPFPPPPPWEEILKNRENTISVLTRSLSDKMAELMSSKPTRDTEKARSLTYNEAVEAMIRKVAGRFQNTMPVLDEVVDQRHANRPREKDYDQLNRIGYAVMAPYYNALLWAAYKAGNYENRLPASVISDLINDLSDKMTKKYKSRNLVEALDDEDEPLVDTLRLFMKERVTRQAKEMINKRLNKVTFGRRGDAQELEIKHFLQDTKKLISNLPPYIAEGLNIQEQ